MRFKDRLFEEYVRVFVSPAERIAIQEKPEVIDEVMPNADLLLLQGIEMSIEHSNESYIVERLMGAPMQTGDEEDDEYSASLRTPVDMPIHEVVEIFCMAKGIRFAHPEGMLRVLDVCAGYLDEYETDRKYDMNLPPAPQEDLDKMEYTVKQLKPYASKVKHKRQYSAEWAMLMEGVIEDTFINVGEDGNVNGFLVTADDTAETRRHETQDADFSKGLSHVYGFSRG